MLGQRWLGESWEGAHPTCQMTDSIAILVYSAPYRHGMLTSIFIVFPVQYCEPIIGLGTEQKFPLRVCLKEWLDGILQSQPVAEPDMIESRVRVFPLLP